MKWLKTRLGQDFRLSCAVSILVKILLLKLKSLFIKYALILIMKKKNVKGDKIKMVGNVNTFDHYRDKPNFSPLFRSPVKL